MADNTEISSARPLGPWSVSTAPGTVDVRGFHGTFVAMCDLDCRHGVAEADANAAFIVKACNAHDELVTALLKVQTDMLRDDFDSENDRCDYVLGYVRAALTKVQS